MNFLIGLLCFSFTTVPFSASAADVEAGKAKSVVCTSCHGANGISISSEIPNLAGQKAGYLVKSIKDFKSGDRKNSMMSSVVAMISDADIENIAAYFSSLK